MWETLRRTNNEILGVKGLGLRMGKQNSPAPKGKKILNA